MQRGNYGAVREWELPFPKSLYRNIVAQLGAHLFDPSCQVVDRDQAPVTISGWNRDAIDRRGFALNLWLDLVVALCRGFRYVQHANGGRGANAESTKVFKRAHRSMKHGLLLSTSATKSRREHC